MVAAIADNVHMPPGHLHYYGSYRYDSRETLQRAVAQASNEFFEEDGGPPSLGLIQQGLRIHVDLTLSAAADSRFAAAGMLEVLASNAIDGVVEARHGSDHVDFYCREDD